MACTPDPKTAAETDPWNLLLAEARGHAVRARAWARDAGHGGAAGVAVDGLLRAQWLRGVAGVVARMPNPQHRQDLSAALAVEAATAEADAAPAARAMAGQLQQQLRSLAAGGSPAFALGLLALGVAPAGFWLDQHRPLPGTALALLSIAAVLARAAALRPELAAGMRAGVAVRQAFLQAFHRRGRVA